jgi:hypothetical protein
MQWSAPITGWLERNWVKAGVNYKRIDGAVSQEQRTIKSGCVVDAVGRSEFAMNQVTQVIKMMEAGEITSKDIIYFDDFWHPGIEAVKYVGEVIGSHPKLYGFLHAQSVDEFDFTYKMRPWMRHFEKGIASILEKVFVCCPTLADLVVFGGICERDKVAVTGHPFNSEEVLERMPVVYTAPMNNPKIDYNYIDTRNDTVVFSSRFDREKNPHFFMDVAERSIVTGKKAAFAICTGSAKLKSNDPSAVERARDMVKVFPKKFVIREGLTKNQYYDILCCSPIQFNTADQDFVAITLLEASVAGCIPIYPYFRSFPETLHGKEDYLYRRLDVDDALSKISGIIDDPEMHEKYFTKKAIQERAWIHKRFDSSWIRMLQEMEAIPTNLMRSNECHWKAPLHYMAQNIQEFEAASIDPFAY